MIKRVSELTERDKTAFVEAALAESEMKNPGINIRQRILDDIDSIFDDEKFLKRSPDDLIDGAHARKAFGKNKPSLEDYLIWMTTFVTHREYVDIPAHH